jgi:hypothetical protein
MTGVQLRENALFTALMMELTAPAAGLDEREAYTAGLLRSIGKIAIDRISKGQRGWCLTRAAGGNCRLGNRRRWADQCRGRRDDFG